MAHGLITESHQLSAPAPEAETGLVQGVPSTGGFLAGFALGLK